MGQYYNIVNLSKNEGFHPYDVDSPAKLMEFAYFQSIPAITLMKLLQSEWKNQKIIIIGDYFPDHSPRKRLYSIRLEQSGETLKSIVKSSVDEIKRIYSQNTIKDFVSSFLEEHRFFINHDRKQYIDLLKYFRQEPEINPVILLLAVGNELGLGGYYGINQEYVGTWAGETVEISKRPPSNYMEISIYFSENTKKNNQKSATVNLTEKDTIRKIIESSNNTIYILHTRSNNQNTKHFYKIFVIENGKLINITFPLSKLNIEYNEDTGEIVVSGCGVDTSVILTYEISQELYGFKYAIESKHIY